jgi:Predicted integral membrane protein
MKRNSELKSEAAAALSGNWAMSAIITLVYLLIIEAPCYPYTFNIDGDVTFSYYNLFIILLLPLQFGYYNAFLDVLRTRKAEFASMFDVFKDYGRVLGTVLLYTIYVILWSMLFIIPGIIKSYSYILTPYVMKDNPDLCYNAAIEKSMQMMSGHKMKLFLLDLSLIGWIILSILTLGIGFLFLAPYASTAHAAFYQNLKNEQPDSIEIIEEK